MKYTVKYCVSGPGRVLRISSYGDDRRIFHSWIFFGYENLASIQCFGWLDLIRDFGGGYSKQSEDSR